MDLRNGVSKSCKASTIVEDLRVPIYGYKRAVVDKEFDLLDLREISFDLRPDDLRRVARFLEHYAAEIESGGWRSSHVHITITSFDHSWKAGHAESDVIKLNPDPEPPAVFH